MAACSTSRALGDDAHVGAQLLDDLQHVRREEHRRAPLDELPQRVPQHPRRHRVNALERLVEKQQVRVRQQGRRQARASSSCHASTRA